MYKIIATIVKEWQLMKRDISGLLLLLVMPAALIVVMAIIQDAPFKDYQELKFDLLLADDDRGSVARQVTAGLKQSRNFTVIDTVDGVPLSEGRLKQLLNEGKSKIGILIPKGITAEVVNSANIIVNDFAKKAGMNANMPAREVREHVFIHLYFDPVTKPAFRTAISAALDKYIAWSCSGVLVQRLAAMGGDTIAAGNDAGAGDLKKVMQGVGVKEVSLDESKAYTQHMSSVQHNVPAWAIFGMFFIVIPIAGHMIREREDGSAVRTLLIPDAYKYITIGKIMFYTLVCMLQFMLMLSIGLWAMPLFGMEPLYPGMHAGLLLPVAVAISFAATAYGFFIGSVFRTINQALPFGSISIVILSAIGGIWVPVEILPHTMQMMALASPLHWSLQAVNQVILRNGDLGSVLFPISVLLFTGGALWAASVAIGKVRTVS